MKNIVVVIGASSGFGALTSRALPRAGHTIYASVLETTGRNVPQVKEAEEYAIDHGVDLRAIELDESSQESIDVALKTIISENGRLDLVIHNAGHMGFGSSEAFTPEQLARLYDTNLLSTQRVNRAALTHFRKQRKGLVDWVSSSGTHGGTPPYLALYFAAKAAMDSLAVSCSSQLARWGIETSNLVPGAFTSGTNHFKNAGFPNDNERATEYDPTAHKGLADQIQMGLAECNPPDADVGAVTDTILKVVDMPFGKRTFRVHVDPAQDCCEVVNVVADRNRAEFLRRVGLGHLLASQVND
jgi:NAD(P)-dependent dehydrogenase (short-subunit alcohol dehydrogenase family)